MLTKSKKSFDKGPKTTMHFKVYMCIMVYLYIYGNNKIINKNILTNKNLQNVICT